MKLTPEMLIEWRARLEISQVEAEHRLGMGNKGRTWRRWEKGERKIPAWLNYIHTWLPDLPDEAFWKRLRKGR